MKSLHKILSTAFLLCFACGVEVSAQQHFRSAYFMDGYNYAYRLNPAIPSERGFFSPLIGNISADFECNLPLTAFLYRKPDSSCKWFMDDEVGDEEFLSRIKSRNKINASVSNTIFACGFWVGKSFNTLEINSRTDVGLSLPYDAFRLLKTGDMSGTDIYDMANLGLKLNGMLELSYGYTRRVARWVSFGFRLKALGSVASADLAISSAKYVPAGDHWTVSADGEFDISLPDGLTIPTLEDGTTLDFNNIQASSKVVDYFKLPGYGGALDLGFTFDFGEYVTASIAVTDLGLLYHRNHIAGRTLADADWVYTGYPDDAPTGEILGCAAMSFNFQKADTKKGRLEMLPPTVNAGIQLRMPFYQRLSIGILGTGRIDGRNYSWYEGRVSVNFAILDWLSFNGNYAYSNFGHSAGSALNIHTLGFSLFIGTDSLLPLTCYEDKLPVRDFNTGVNFGINFNFGKTRHSRFGKNAIRPWDDFNYKSKISDDAKVSIEM